MTKSEQILNWYKEIEFNLELPEDIQVLNPYRDMHPSTLDALEEFYNRYYNDTKPRKLILGINPGRLGAGLTGIPFTDTPALESIGIYDSEVSTTETSADFVWKLVQAYGGPEKFFGEWFIGAVSPLGFVHRNEKGNWVNFNYYDRPEIHRLLTPFIEHQIKLQVALAGNAKNVAVFGTGKNAKAVTDLNKKLQLFTSIEALEHPRFVMQYRRRRVDEYLKRFVEVLQTKQ